MKQYDEYDLLNLAVLKQAQDDYYDYHIKVLQLGKKIKLLEQLGYWRSEEVRDLQALQRKYKVEIEDILKWWEMSYKAFYCDMLDYDVILDRFNEIEKEAIETIKNENKLKRKHKILW